MSDAKPNAQEGANSNTTAGGEPSEDDKPITRGALAGMLKELLPGVLNPAITNHLSRFEKKLGDKFATKPAPPAEGENNDEPTGEQPKGAKPSGGGQDPKKHEPNPELDALRKEIASLRRQNEKAAEQAKAEARRRVELEGHTSLKNALSGKVVAGSEDVVLSTLKGRGAIHIGDDGQVHLKLGAKDEPEDGFDLDDGIATYLKTQEAKFFLPVPTGGTNGGKRPNHSANGNDPMSRLADKTGKQFDELL